MTFRRSNESVGLRISPALLLLMMVLCAPRTSDAQETIFSVPNHDILPGGHLSATGFFSLRPWDPSFFQVMPRIVGGIGRNMEAGVSVQSVTLVQPHGEAMRWALKRVDTLDNERSISLSEGLLAVSPLAAGTSSGSMLYISGAMIPIEYLRVTLGGFVAAGSISGGTAAVGVMLASEYQLTDNLKLAAEIFTGHSSLGYLTAGVIYIPMDGFELRAAFQGSNTSGYLNSLLIGIGYAP